LAFRIKDKIVILEAGLTQAERNAQAPGKQHTTGQLIVCNPSIAACQRALGLDPETDLTFFANPQGTYTLLDIFCGNFDAWADTVTNVYVGKGSDFFMCATTTSYGSYVHPGNNIAATQGTSRYFSQYNLTCAINGGSINTINFALVNNCVICCVTGTSYYYCTTVHGCAFGTGAGPQYINGGYYYLSQDSCRVNFPMYDYITIS